MKKYPVITISSLLLSAAGLHAQATEEAFTTPVGYVTHTLKAGQFNLVGLTVHNPIEVSGDFEAVSGTTLTDTDADFNTSLTDGDTYILEITSGALAGTIQEVLWASNGATTLVTSDNLGAEGLVASDTYQMRKAATLSTVFGENNDVGLVGGTASSVSDNIFIPNSSSGFDVYYYSTGGFVGAGWRKVGEGSVDFKDQVMFLSDGFYIKKINEDLELVISGTVKLEGVNLAITQEFSFLSGVFPVGATFESSNLSGSLIGGTASAISDNVFVQKTDGTFDVYYYSTGGFVGAGWRLVGDSSTDHADTELPSAFVVKRVADSDFNIDLAAPADYGSL